MRNPAAETQMLGSLKPEKAGSIHIGQIRTDNQRGHRKAGLALEAALAKNRSKQAMRQIIHAGALGLEAHSHNCKTFNRPNPNPWDGLHRGPLPQKLATFGQSQAVSQD